MLGPAAPRLNGYCADGKRLAHPVGSVGGATPRSLDCNLFISNALRYAEAVQELALLKEVSS
jgi:hypothetical protein